MIAWNYFQLQQNFCMMFKAETAKRTVIPLLTLDALEVLKCFPLQIFGDCVRYWAFRWQRHSEANAMSIWNSKQAARFFFPMSERSEKCTHSFFLLVHVCIIIIGVISRRHISPNCVRPITLVAGLCTTCRGEGVSVVIKFNVIFLPLRPYFKKCVPVSWTMPNVQQCMVARFDGVRLFMPVLVHFHWTLQPHFTLWQSARTLQC